MAPKWPRNEPKVNWKEPENEPKVTPNQPETSPNLAPARHLNTGMAMG